MSTTLPTLPFRSKWWPGATQRGWFLSLTFCPNEIGFMTSLIADHCTQRNGSEIIVAVVCDVDCTKEYARKLGDNAVRLCKSLSDDTGPEKAIGAGKYDYKIGVGASPDNIMVQGFKSCRLSHITW